MHDSPVSIQSVTTHHHSSLASAKVAFLRFFLFGVAATKVTGTPDLSSYHHPCLLACVPALTAYACQQLAASLVCSATFRIPLQYAHPVMLDMLDWLMPAYSGLLTCACILMVAYLHPCITTRVNSCCGHVAAAACENVAQITSCGLAC